MTARAFVLIETAVGRSKEVVAALRELKGMTSVDTVTGPYDIITIIVKICHITNYIDIVR